MILITHDLGLVAGIADRILVMYAGRVVEEGPTDQIFYEPQHPYTLGLLGAVPSLARRRQRRCAPSKALPPVLIDPPNGCAFAPRCPYRMRICRVELRLTSRRSPGTARRAGFTTTRPRLSAQHSSRARRA